jgi:vitamin B12 transporter
MSRIKTTLLLLIFFQAAAAQDTARSLDPVVVTANKFPNKTSRTGKVVTIISRQDIERAGSRDLAQLLNEQGGIYINGANSHPGKDKSVFLRGAKVDHTLIAIDGIPVYDATGIGSNFDIRQLPLESIERIEILKGSQSTLYGSDAIAGVINIITKKADSKPFGGTALLSYGSWQTLRASAGINGNAGILSYNLGLNYFNTGGISEAEKPLTVREAYEKDGYRQQGLQAGLGIQATPQIKLAPFIRISKINGAIDQQPWVDELDFTYTANNLQAGLRNEASFGKTKWHLLYQYNKTGREYLDDSVKSTNGFYRYYRTDYRSKEHFAELYAVQSFQAVQLTTGVDFRRSATDQEGLSNFGADPAISSDSSQQQYGLYTALNYHQRSFNLEGGLRYNHHSNYGGNFAFNFNPSLLISERLKIFANLSTGYKTPTLYQLYSLYGNRSLAPEQSVNWEGGLQYLGVRTMVQATVFSRTVKDVLFFYFDASTFQSKYINQDEQKDHGFEAEWQQQFSSKGQLKLFYTFVDGKISSQVSGRDTTYFNLIRRPKHSLAINLGYTLFKNLYTALQVQYFGTSRDIYFDPASFTSRPITLDGYTLLHLTAEYGFMNNRLKLFADLRNITDKKYNELYGYSAPGFNGYAGVRVRW